MKRSHLAGIEAGGDRPLRATEVLQHCLGESVHAIHSLRSRVLMRAVEARIAGRRLTLIDLARAWPGAQRIRAPLKALDRLLGNRHLHAEREHIHAAMVRWLVRSDQPVIIVDWSDLKADRSGHVLRAAIPVGGRTLTVLDMVFPAGQQGSPKGREAVFAAPRCRAAGERHAHSGDGCGLSWPVVSSRRGDGLALAGMPT